MSETNSLSKFRSPLISFICGKDTISVPGIVCGTLWGSFPVLGSFAVQFGDHLRYWDHLRAGIICGPVQKEMVKNLDGNQLREFCEMVLQIIFSDSSLQKNSHIETN